jgi:hypothetical protein
LQSALRIDALLPVSAPGKPTLRTAAHSACFFKIGIMRV